MHAQIDLISTQQIARLLKFFHEYFQAESRDKASIARHPQCLCLGNPFPCITEELVPDGPITMNQSAGEKVYMADLSAESI